MSGGPTGRVTAPSPHDLARAAVGVAPRRAPPSWSASARARGVTVADTKSSDVDVVTEADRASEALIRRAAARARAPTTRSSARRASDAAGHLGRALDRRPDRRHRELPLRPPAVRRLDRRRGRRRGRRRAWSLNAATGRRVRRRPAGRPGADPRRRPDRASAARRRCPQRLVGTGFSYDAGLRALQAGGGGAAAARGCATSAASARAPWTCATSPRGALDAYVEEGVNLWDHAAGALVGPEAGRPHRAAPSGLGGRDLMVCAPAHGFDEFRGRRPATPASCAEAGRTRVRGIAPRPSPMFTATRRGPVRTSGRGHGAQSGAPTARRVQARGVTASGHQGVK